MMMDHTFDALGFGMRWDNQDNPTNAFCKRYRASVIQTPRHAIDMEPLSPTMRNLAEASEMYTKKHPIMSIELTNENLDQVIKDFDELSSIKQFLLTHPKIMDEYQKYLFWKKISK